MEYLILCNEFIHINYVRRESMNLSEDIFKELITLGLIDKSNINFKEIRNKDGIYLYRVSYNNDFFVLKYFLNDEYKREIKNYLLLKELGVPTINVIGNTDRSILLEDLEKSINFRLGVKSDLSDIEVARALAKWYVKLHSVGSKYISKENPEFYREVDNITKDNIEFIKIKSNTKDKKVWDLITDNWSLFLGKITSLEETLTYNDFYWTNLVVSNDKKESIMFDYNLLGVGFRYNDIRNVCSALSEKAQKAFMDEYGEFNEKEKIVDDGIADLINLICAYKKTIFPNWAESSLNAIHNGKLEQNIKKILNLSC
jgi:hypothetical protein